MKSPDLSRSGQCVACGVDVYLHFDLTNRKLSCEEALFTQQMLDLVPAPAKDGDRPRQAPGRLLQFARR